MRYQKAPQQPTEHRHTGGGYSETPLAKPALSAAEIAFVHLLFDIPASTAKTDSQSTFPNRPCLHGAAWPTVHRCVAKFDVRTPFVK
jgi:hypothetical protein